MTARGPRALDSLVALLCFWAAAYHTPVGALCRELLGRLTGVKPNVRPLLAYYTAPDVISRGVPQSIAPLSRGVLAAATTLNGSARAGLESIERRYSRPLLTAADAAFLVAQAREELGSQDAAVLAIFAGYEVVHHAVASAQEQNFESLSRQLAPSSADAVGAASSALTLGTAYSLGWPVPEGTRVSSPFGWRTHPTLDRPQFHSGVDLAVPERTRVRAVGRGVVRRAREDAVNGRMLVVDHGRGVTTAYCHNSALWVTVGQQVQEGEVIADSGSTGRSTGPHVHYQLELGNQPVDPLAFRPSEHVVTGKAMLQAPR